MPINYSYQGKEKYFGFSLSLERMCFNLSTILSRICKMKRIEQIKTIIFIHVYVILEIMWIICAVYDFKFLTIKHIKKKFCLRND